MLKPLTAAARLRSAVAGLFVLAAALLVLPQVPTVVQSDAVATFTVLPNFCKVLDFYHFFRRPPQAAGQLLPFSRPKILKNRPLLRFFAGRLRRPALLPFYAKSRQLPTFTVLRQNVPTFTLPRPYRQIARITPR